MCQTTFDRNSTSMLSSASFSSRGKDNQYEDEKAKESIVQFFFRFPVPGYGYKFIVLSFDPFTTTLRQVKEHLLSNSGMECSTLPLVECPTYQMEEEGTTGNEKNDFGIDQLLKRKQNKVFHNDIGLASKQPPVKDQKGQETYGYANAMANVTEMMTPSFYSKSKINKDDLYLSCGSKCLHDNDAYLNDLLSITANSSSIYPTTIHVGIKQRGGCFLVSATIALILFIAILLAPVTCGTSLCVFPFLFPLLFVLPLCLL